MKKVVLKNSFHNSEVTLVVENDQISAGQVKKAWKTLCGIRGCTCGNSLGMRGENPRVEINQDGSAYLLED